MRAIATITTAPERVALTTLARVKAELNITTTDAARDQLLTAKILEASNDIESKLGRKLARCGITMRVWGEPGGAEFFSLDRYPVASITSITVDGVAIDVSAPDTAELRIDQEAGLLYRLDASGYPCHWLWCKDVSIVYTGGYELPGAQSPTLEAVLEAAAIELMTQYWTARGRDPTLRSEEIPNLGAFTYWVGAVGESGELPPSVMSKISPFRRSQV